MWKWLLVPFLVDFTWERLHATQSVAELRAAVQEYQESFPCEECREHFCDLVEHHPFPIENVRSIADMRAWTWLTHNLVNKRIGKEWVSFDVMV